MCVVIKLDEDFNNDLLRCKFKKTDCKKFKQWWDTYFQETKQGLYREPFIYCLKLMRGFKKLNNDELQVVMKMFDCHFEDIVLDEIHLILITFEPSIVDDWRMYMASHVLKKTKGKMSNYLRLINKYNNYIIQWNIFDEYYKHFSQYVNEELHDYISLLKRKYNKLYTYLPELKTYEP